MLFPDLFGNAAVRDRLGHALRSGTLPHALMIVGPRGSGRRTLSKMLALSLFCEAGKEASTLPCGVCRSCRRAKEGNLLDLHVIKPEEGKSLLGVGAIRDIRSDLALSAAEADCRVFLIEDADKMNAAAQNALLISLEEPPSDVYFLLIAEREEDLLPTVRSRCQTVRTELFDRDTLRAHLEGDSRFRSLEAREPEKAEALLSAANGTVGGALALLDEATLTEVMRRRDAVDAITRSLGERGGGALYLAMRPLGNEKREELILLLSLLSDALRDLILLKKDKGAPLVYHTDRTAAEEMAEQVGIRRLLTFFDAVAAAASDLLRNANVSVVLATLLHAALT